MYLQQVKQVDRISHFSSLLFMNAMRKFLISVTKKVYLRLSVNTLTYLKLFSRLFRGGFIRSREQATKCNLGYLCVMDRGDHRAPFRTVKQKKVMRTQEIKRSWVVMDGEWSRYVIVDSRLNERWWNVKVFLWNKRLLAQLGWNKIFSNMCSHVHNTNASQTKQSLYYYACMIVW